MYSRFIQLIKYNINILKTCNLTHLYIISSNKILYTKRTVLYRTKKNVHFLVQFSWFFEEGVVLVRFFFFKISEIKGKVFLNNVHFLPSSLSFLRFHMTRTIVTDKCVIDEVDGQCNVNTTLRPNLRFGLLCRNQYKCYKCKFYLWNDFDNDSQILISRQLTRCDGALCQHFLLMILPRAVHDKMCACF